MGKSVGHHGWIMTENIKTILAKTPQNRHKKKNLNQKINDSKPYFLSLSFTFRFSNRKSKIQQKPAKKITHFTNLKSLNIEKNILPQHGQSLTHFTNFPANLFLVGVRKDMCTTLFPDAQVLHSQRA